MFHKKRKELKALIGSSNLLTLKKAKIISFQDYEHAPPSPVEHDRSYKIKYKDEIFYIDTIRGLKELYIFRGPNIRYGGRGDYQDDIKRLEQHLYKRIHDEKRSS
jgi:hypothetical protein